MIVLLFYLPTTFHANAPHQARSGKGPLVPWQVIIPTCTSVAHSFLADAHLGKAGGGGPLLRALLLGAVRKAHKRTRDAEEMRRDRDRAVEEKVRVQELLDSTLRNKEKVSIMFLPAFFFHFVCHPKSFYVTPADIHGTFVDDPLVVTR